MNLNDALAQLPEAYATALRLQLAGATTEAIGAQLQTDPAAVPNLLELAVRKLVAVLQDPQTIEASEQ
jgi:DNA-directed RNA polymerase specialized sigma24 family protein